MVYKLTLKRLDGELRTIYMDGPADCEAAKAELQRQQKLVKRDGSTYFPAGEITSVEIVSNPPPPPKAKVKMDDGTVAEVDPRRMMR